MSGTAAEVLRFGWLQWRSQHGRWATGFWALLVLALVVAGIAAGGQLRLVTQVLAPTLALAIAWAWGVSVLLQQNHPRDARLVPGHLKSLTRVLLAAWFSFSLAGMATGTWLGLSAAAAWTISATLTLVIAICMRWPLLWALIWLLPPLLSRVAGLPGWLDAWALLSLHPWPCAGATLLLAPWLLAGLLGHGGERHRLSHQRQQRWRMALRKSQIGQSVRPYEQGLAPLRWLGLLAQAPYFAWLARRSNAARPGEVMSRLCLGLGPNAHWVGQLGGLLIFAVTMAAVMVLVLAVAPQAFRRFMDSASIGLSIGVMTFALGQVAGIRGALHQTRREQALLSLLPGLPRGAGLNRALALRLAAQFLPSWLLCSLLVLAMSAGSPTLPGIWLFSATALASGTLLWADWSRAAPASMWRQAMPMLLPTLAAALAWAVHAGIGVPLSWLVGGLLVATAGLAAWRWRVVCAAPAALPAGRLFRLPA